MIRLIADLADPSGGDEIAAKAENVPDKDLAGFHRSIDFHGPDNLHYIEDSVPRDWFGQAHADKRQLAAMNQNRTRNCPPWILQLPLNIFPAFFAQITIA